MTKRKHTLSGESIAVSKLNEENSRTSLNSSMDSAVSADSRLDQPSSCDILFTVKKADISYECDFSQYPHLSPVLAHLHQAECSLETLAELVEVWISRVSRDHNVTEEETLAYLNVFAVLLATLTDGTQKAQKQFSPLAQLHHRLEEKTRETLLKGAK